MDLAGFPATQQKALLDSGRASCRELLAACRTRAELTEPVVNAIPTVEWEAAEMLAGRLDDDSMLLEGAPLRGLVTAHKDLSDTAGMRTPTGRLSSQTTYPTPMPRSSPTSAGVASFPSARPTHRSSARAPTPSTPCMA